MSDTEPRAPGCKCHWEGGDSLCPVHHQDEGDPKDHNWEQTAKSLWMLLDSIDTLSDSMKPERTAYMLKVDEIAARRHKLLKSDGYTLSVAPKT